MLSSVFTLAFAVTLSGIFFSAGLSKWRPENLAFYKSAIAAYELTPPAWSRSIVRPLAVAELVLALLLLIPLTQQFALLAAALLLSVYLYALAKQLMQGKADMECGCAGPGSEMKISKALLARNALLIVLAVAAYLIAGTQTNAVWPSTAVLISFPTAAILSLLYLSSQQLINNSQKIQAIRQSGY